MIPSRTVFNHCKWIYIELAITGAHSGMGPLCISSAPTPAARARANVFPISSLRATNCSNPSTPGIVSCSQPYIPLGSSFLSHSLILSLRCYPLDIAFFFLLQSLLILSIHFSFIPLFSFFLTTLKSRYVSLSRFSFFSIILKAVFLPILFLPASLGFHISFYLF